MGVETFADHGPIDVHHVVELSIADRVGQPVGAIEYPRLSKSNAAQAGGWLGETKIGG